MPNTHPLTSSHASSLSAIHCAAFEAGGFRGWSIEECAEMLEREEYFGWVIEEHAFLLLRSTDETECEIVSLAVHPEHQRKGLAKQLIKHAIQTLSSRSISTPPLRGSQNAQHFGGGYSTAITIHLEVRETNAPARALYASLGFTETGTRPNYYKDGNGSRVAAVMMTYKKD